MKMFFAMCTAILIGCSSVKQAQTVPVYIYTNAPSLGTERRELQQIKREYRVQLRMLAQKQREYDAKMKALSRFVNQTNVHAAQIPMVVFNENAVYNPHFEKQYGDDTSFYGTGLSYSGWGGFGGFAVYNPYIFKNQMGVCGSSFATNPSIPGNSFGGGSGSSPSITNPRIQR